MPGCHQHQLTLLSLSVHTHTVRNVSTLASRHQLIKIVLAECPQGSVLGPLLFSVYVSPIGCIASDHGISLQQYADDTQLHISVSTDDLTVQLSALESSCLHSLHSWLCHNGLALNSSKSKSILLDTSSRIHNFPPLSGVAIAGFIVPLSDRIVTLGPLLITTYPSDTMFPRFAGLLTSTCEHYATFERLLLMTWVKQWLFHLFTLASTMLTLSFTDPLTSEGCSVYRTQLPGWY